MTYKVEPPPKRVVQKGNESCWAAALESWLVAVKATHRATQGELTTSIQFGIDVQAFRDSATLWEMVTTTANDLPAAAEIEKTLRQLGCLYIGSRLPDAYWWHCVVLFGVTTPKRDEPTYHYMDPGDGNYHVEPKSALLKGAEPQLLVGWHKTRQVRRGK